VFNGFTEKEKAPKALNGEHVYQQVKNSTRDMKKRNKIQLKRICERSGQYFLIARMKFFVCRYCLDVMHIEKNVCDCIIDTLLNIPDKTKDTVKLKLNLVEMRISKQLGPYKRDQYIYLPPACHTLFRKENI